MLERIIIILVLFTVTAVAIASCSAMSQETYMHGIDTAAQVIDRQPSAGELLMQSRQTAPVQADGNSLLWIGVAVALIIVILMSGGLAYFIFGERWLKERRKYINAQKRANRPPTQRPPIPQAQLPPMSNVPRLRQVQELPPPQEYRNDYGI